MCRRSWNNADIQPRSAAFCSCRVALNCLSCRAASAKSRRFFSIAIRSRLGSLMFRRLAPYLVIVFLLPCALTAEASEPRKPLPAGTAVLAKHPGVYFRIKNDNVGEMHAGVVEHVQKRQGEWLWLGRGWVRQGNVVPIWDAVEFFTTEISRQPSAFAYVGRAGAAGARHAYPAEIADDVKKAIELDPDFAAGHWMRGRLHSAAGNFDAALDAYDEAILLDPRFADVYQDRGYTRWSKNEFDKALKELRAAIRVAPLLASAYATRGLILHSQAKNDEALAEAREALRRDPNNAMAHVVIGWYWSLKEDDQQAIDAYTKAIEADANCGQARLQRGIAYSLHGNLQKALLDLNRAVQLMPKNTEALEARAVAYYRLGVVDKYAADRVAVARLKNATGQRAVEPGKTAETNTPPHSAGETSKNQPSLLDSQNWTIGVTQPTDSGTLAPPVASPLAVTNSKRANELNSTARRGATSIDERYRNGPRAVEFATEACEKSDWKRPEFIDTLAAAYAECRDFDQAIKWQNKAIELATGVTVKAEAEQRLRLYRDHQPCREEAEGRLAESMPGDRKRR